MPLTTGFTSRLAIKGEGHIHTEKWHRCVEHVKAKGGGYEPHAVCTFSIGYNESINEEHQTPGPHSSRDTRRFKRRKERKEAEKMDSYAAVLKFNKNHSKEDGRFTSGSGGGGGGSDKATASAKSRIVPHGRISDEDVKALGLKPGKYRNVRGVGIMGHTHEELKRMPAENADTGAVISAGLADRQAKNKKTSAKDQAYLNRRAAEDHAAAAKEYEALGESDKVAHHKERAKHYKEQHKHYKALV